MLAGGAASAADDSASCVGQFSSYYAHGGGGTHRSDVAQDFARNSKPAGLHVYSHYAKFHGSLAQCFG